MSTEEQNAAEEYRDSLGIALRQIMEEDIRRKERERLLQGPDAELEALTPEQIEQLGLRQAAVDLSYYERAKYLISLFQRAEEGCDIDFSADEVSDLELMQQITREFCDDHPTCRKCRWINLRGAKRCADCGSTLPG